MTEAGSGPTGAADEGPQELPPQPSAEESAPADVPDAALQPVAGGDAGGAPAQGEGATDSY